MYTKYIYQITLIFISISLFTSSTLISLYLKKDKVTDKIALDLIKSKELWKIESLKIDDVKTTRESEIEKGTNETVSFSDFVWESTNFIARELEAELKVAAHTNSSIELTSSKSPLQMRMTFNYNYTINYANNTKNSNIGQGWVSIFSNFINYTQSYQDLSYEITHYLKINLIYFDSFISKENMRINDILKQEISVSEVLVPLSEQTSNIIIAGLKESLKKAEEKNFLQLTRYDGRNFTLSTVSAANPKVVDSNSVIYTYDGSIKEATNLQVEDSTIPAFVNFTTKGSIGESSFQYFLNKKIFVNLLDMQFEKQLFYMDRETLALLNVTNYDFTINWLSKFYPEILNYRPLNERFTIEYYFNNISWENNNAKVDITFFFVSTSNVEVVLEYTMSYYFILEVVTKQNSDGNLSVNFILTNPDSFKLINFNLLTNISSRFDFRNFKQFAQNFVLLVFKSRNYYLFKNYETFGNLQFNNVEVRDDGIVLGMLKPPQVQALKYLKFLN